MGVVVGDVLVPVMRVLLLLLIPLFKSVLGVLMVVVLVSGAVELSSWFCD